MAREYEYLLHILGAHLRREAPEVRPDADWEKLVKLSQIHGVAGILGAMAVKYPICPEPERRKELRTLCHRTVELFTRRTLLARELLEQLEAAGVDHIPMKGYVLRDYYPVPELRSFGDIDLVIRPEDRQRVHTLMVSRGFETKTDWEPVFSYARGRELYELHTEILEVDIPGCGTQRPYFRRVWDHARRERGCLWQPEPEFHFLYLLAHLAKHAAGSGAGARMYLDLAAFILHFGDAVDWPRIGQELKSLGLWRFGCAAFTAVERWFGVAVPFAYEPAAEEVMAEFLQYTMDAGVFGQHNRSASLTGLKRAGETTLPGRLGLLLQRLFPAAKTIEPRYTYLKKHPWLLPFAWIHRLVRTRKTLGAHTREVGDIFRADSGEADRLGRLMRAVGLAETGLK